MRLGELQRKDVVSILDGRRLGRISDVEINENGAILHFVVEFRRLFRFFASNSETTITFEQIHKIGEDVILVNL